jgi:hypothetical protein
MAKSSIFWCGLLAVALAACGTSTKVPTAWKDPAYTGAGFEKIFVIAIGDNDGARRLYEDSLASELSKRGLTATASYTHLPNSERLSEGAIHEAMQGGSFDAVTISHLIGEKEETKYVPPRTYTVPRGGYGYGYYGYYSAGWDTVHEPGYYKTNTIVRLETNLYRVSDKALIWSGQSDTLNPKSVADTIDSATRAIAKQLGKDGVIR